MRLFSGTDAILSWLMAQDALEKSSTLCDQLYAFVVGGKLASGLAQCRLDFYLACVDGLAGGKLITGSRAKVDLALGSPSYLKILSPFFHIKRICKIMANEFSLWIN